MTTEYTNLYMMPTDKLIAMADLSNPEISELVKRIETMMRDSKVLWSSVEAGHQVDKSRIEHLTKQLEVGKIKNEALEETVAGLECRVGAADKVFITKIEGLLNEQI